MQTVTLNLPRHLASKANSVAHATQQSLEDTLIAWLDQAAADLPVNLLSDEQILALTQSEMDQGDQEELSLLSADLREGVLSLSGEQRLGELMSIYRNGLRRKSEAFKIAVQRGILPPLYNATLITSSDMPPALS